MAVVRAGRASPVHVTVMCPSRARFVYRFVTRLLEVHYRLSDSSES
jgi:hypothetical protein